MGFIELLEMGFFHTFFNFSNPYISVPVYILVFIGFFVQTNILKKYTARRKYSFIFVCICGIFISEIIWNNITGWDRIAVDLIYGFIICLLIGAFIGSIFYASRKK